MTSTMDDPVLPSSSERCARCGETVGRFDRFCPGCGASRGVICPSCGLPTTSPARYCPECGGPLPVPPPVLPSTVQPERGRTGRAAGRGRRLLAGATVCLLLIFSAVAWIYFTAPERQQERPIAEVSTRTPSTLMIQLGSSPRFLLGTASGLLVSDDAGRTWQQLLINGGVTAIGISSSDTSPVYLAGTRFWRGDGQSFAEVQSDLPASSIQALAVDTVNPRRVFAATTDRRLARSDDGGQHWVTVGSNLPPHLTSLVLAGRDQPLFVAATSDQGVFASVDGRAWSNANGFVNGALPTQTIYALAFDPHSGDRYVGPTGVVQEGALYAATNLGVFKSIDSGQSWSALPLRRAIGGIAVSPRGDRFMLAVDLNGAVFRSRDGGVSWR